MEKEIKVLKGDLAVDDRGTVSFVNDFDFSDVKRFYVVENHRPGFIRAWHGHHHEGKYVHVVQGSILLGVAPMSSSSEMDREDKAKTFVLSSKKPTIIFIPGGYANGFKTLEENTKIVFYSTATMAESANDDTRFEYTHWGNNIWSENYR